MENEDRNKYGNLNTDENLRKEFDENPKGLEKILDEKYGEIVEKIEKYGAKNSLVNIAKKGAGDSILSLLSIGSGLYHGFCDAKNIPFDSAMTEDLLTYGPTVLAAGVPTVVSGLAGLVIGSGFGTFIGYEVGKDCVKLDDSKIMKNSKITASTIAGTGITGTVGTGIGVVSGAIAGGAIKRGVQTTIGYGAGYVIGKVFD